VKTCHSLLISKIRKFVFVFVLLFIPIIGNASFKSDPRSKIVFRFDDFELNSTAFNDSLLYIFRKNEIPICLGIIPFDKNGIFQKDLTKKQLEDFKESITKNEVEIALHGYNHKDNEVQKGSFLINPVASEFAKLSFIAQHTKLKLAKESIDSLLEIQVNIFIPPFNTYDVNTLKALDSLKMEIISASLDGPSNSAIIKYIPYTCNDLNKLPKIIKKYQNDNIVIVALMHSYSFKGGNNYPGSPSKRIDFKQLDTLLCWIKNQNYIDATTFSILNQNGVFDNKRFVLNSLNNNFLFKVLNKMEIYRYGVYNTSEYEIRFKGIFTLFNILFHIILFVIIYGITKIISKMIRPSKRNAVIFFAFVISVSLLFIYSKINSHSLMTLSFLIITVFGALLLGTIRANKYSTKA
jgi:hypothetical protein